MAFVDRFFFADVAARRIAILRIGFAFMALIICLWDLNISRFHFSNAGWIHGDDLPWMSHYAQIWGRWGWGWEPAAVKTLFAVGAGFATTMMLGLWARFSNLIVYLILAAAFSRNPTITGGADSMVLHVIFLLLFARTDLAWSISTGTGECEAKLCSPWPLRMVQIFICLVYTVAGGAKLLGEDWQNGTATFYILASPEFSRWGLPFLAKSPWGDALAFLTRLVPYWETAFPILLIFRRTRLPSLALGVIFHLFICVFFKVYYFGEVMLIAYLAFIPDPWLERIEAFWASALMNLQHRSSRF